MAQPANTETEKAVAATKDVADAGKRATEKAADVSRGAAEKAEDVVGRGLQVIHSTGEVQRVVARRTAEGSAEFGQVLVDLLNAQTRHNLDAFKAITDAVDWDQAVKAVDWQKVVEIQGALVRDSLERTAQLTRRYIEVTQSVLNSAASAAQDQARKAA